VTPHADTLVGPELDHPDGTDPPIALPADLARHDATAEAGALFVTASFDQAGASGTFLVDTGTNTNLALDAYWQTVQPASPRAIPADSADFTGNPLHGAYQLGSA